MGSLKMIEKGNPAEDTRLFRRCLGFFGTGVAVITTRHHGKNAGATVNSVASVSLDPPLVLWSISRTSRSFDIFQNAEGFVINILAKNQVDLSRHFASPAPDKFAQIATTPGWNDIPTIDGALAHIECQSVNSYDGGDHVIKVGRALNVCTFEGDPLMFVQGRYAVAVDHPGMRVRPEVPKHTEDRWEPVPNSMISLITRVNRLLLQKFEEQRAAEGVHQSVTRAMDALGETPNITVSALAKKTFQGIRDTEDALTEMKSMGLAVQEGDRFSLTQAGYDSREAIRRRWLQFEAEELSDLSQKQIADTINVLSQLWASR